MFKTFEKGIYEGNPPEEEVSEDKLLKEQEEATKRLELEGLPGYEPGDTSEEDAARRMEEENHKEIQEDK